MTPLFSLGQLTLYIHKCTINMAHGPEGKSHSFPQEQGWSSDVTRIMSEQLSAQHPPSICPSHSFTACFSQEASRDDEYSVSFLQNKLGKTANGSYSGSQGRSQEEV